MVASSSLTVHDDLTGPDCLAVVRKLQSLTSTQKPAVERCRIFCSRYACYATVPRGIIWACSSTQSLEFEIAHKLAMERLFCVGPHVLYILETCTSCIMYYSPLQGEGMESS